MTTTDVTAEIRGLALAVARCPRIPQARESAGDPCHAIVRSQGTQHAWQIPEAWAGGLTTASVLFLSSNPSISQAAPGHDPGTAENYPDETWADDDVVDFITHRFPTYATADGRHLQKNGTWSSRSTKFWRGVRSIASDLLGRIADPAHDYAMTEVVHCKSKAEIGVSTAAKVCAEMHLDRIVAASPAPVVVVLGTKAFVRVRKPWGLPVEAKTSGVPERRIVGGRERLVAYLPHPSNWGTLQTLTTRYPGHIDELRTAALAGMTVGSPRPAEHG